MYRTDFGTLWRRCLRVLGLQGDPASQSERKSVLNIHWKNWCWSWNCNTLATWCEELTHWKRPWCWKRLKAGGEVDDRGSDCCMASPTQWTWVWVNSGSWWWTGKPGVLQSMGSRRVGHDWETELKWNETVFCHIFKEEKVKFFIFLFMHLLSITVKAECKLLEVVFQIVMVYMILPLNWIVNYVWRRLLHSQI